MPSRGHFVLHSRAVPPLAPGDYVLHGEQQVAGGPTAPLDAHLRVTSPRYRLPPNLILSTYPPANAEGAFESRLPQIVLRRRTLPWERPMVPLSPPAPGEPPPMPPGRDIPWLALVVIAEGEGQLSAEVPIADCVTPGVTLNGPNDVATGVYLGVSQTVVNKVFPTRSDLPLLAHVREVDLQDTELAMGDDDGFMAVIMANRLPQYDRVNCQPVRYLACVISLEGQLNALPPESVNDADHFFALEHVQDLAAIAAAQGKPVVPDKVVMGTGLPPTLVGARVADSASQSGQPRERATGVRGLLPGPIASTAVTSSSVTASAAPSATAAGWTFSALRVEEAAVSAAPEEAWRVARDVMAGGWRHNLDGLVVEKTYRFPVLAYWSFTCTGAGSFETLMQGLDVAFLGSVPLDPAARPQPDCTPPVKGDAPPPTPPPRPDLEVTETGHLGLAYQTRRGDGVRAWYRGPFTLHLTEREEPAEDGHLPLAHTSDQLRRLVPDGREDLSLAAAFEIGRLLALSQPAIVASFLRWREERFGEARASRLSSLALEDAVGLGVKGSLGDLGQLVGKRFLVEASRDVERVIGPTRPPADPGRPLTYARGDVDEIIASGFGLDVRKVRELSSKLGPVKALASLQVPQVPSREFDAQALDRLKAGLDDMVTNLTADVIKTATPGGPGGIGPVRASGAAPARDALDDLIDGAMDQASRRSPRSGSSSDRGQDPEEES